MRSERGPPGVRGEMGLEGRLGPEGKQVGRSSIRSARCRICFLIVNEVTFPLRAPEARMDKSESLDLPDLLDLTELRERLDSLESRVKLNLRVSRWLELC